MMNADEEHSARAAELVRARAFGEELEDDDHRGPELSRDLASGSGILVGRQASRRDRFEALGLLVGILGVLLVVAMTVGAAPPA